MNTRSIASILSLALVLAAGAQTPEALKDSTGILDGTAGGICVLVGPTDTELATAIAKQGPYVVHCLARTELLRDELRAELQKRGLYGTVSADLYTPGRLPYRENLVNMVVVARGVKLAPAEVFRVLAPLGTAFYRIDRSDPLKEVAAIQQAVKQQGATAILRMRWVMAKKPWPKEIDEWGHFLHGADGNPVAKDTVVGPPRRYQWLGDPKWMRSHESDSTISAMVTAQGRLFYISDEAPIGLAGEHDLPDKWSLVACDAFNGTPLWKVPMRRWGWREWKPSWFNTRPGDVPLNVQKRLAAVGDHVYVTLGYHAPVSQIDARSGEILQTYASTEGANEVLVLDGILYSSVVKNYRLRVTAVDTTSGNTLWRSDKEYGGTVADYVKWTAMNGRTPKPKLDPASNLATDGRTVALVDGPRVIALDAKTGKERWATAFPLAKSDANAGGIRAKETTWVGSMILAQNTVIHASPNQLAGVDATSGKVLWKQPKRYIGHLWYEWKDIFVIDGLVWTWGPELERGEYGHGKRVQRTLHPLYLKGYDVRTGAIKKSVPLDATFKANHHHRCYRNKATSRYVIASRRGSEYVDLAGGPHTIDNWIRGICHLGMMPANGLQYAPPHPCQCYGEEKLSGMNAVGPATSPVPAPPDTAPALQVGPAFGKVEAAPAGKDDWPTFRHDGERSGSSDAQLGVAMKLLWARSVGEKVSPPVVAAGAFFVAAADQHRVLCLDAVSGEPRWQYTTGARVDSPPTYHEGLVLFGSTDGHVYCLRATDGALVWRRRAAPETRLMAAFGQLESVWPVNGSVLVQKGVAYFVAGRSSHLDGGLHVYAVAPQTGKILAQTNVVGPYYNSKNVKENFALPQGRLPDILVGDGEKVYMRTMAFTAGLKPSKGKPKQNVPGGYLDDTYFKRIPWRYGGQYGRLLVHNREVMACIRQFDTLRGLDPTVFFTPGDRGYLLFAKSQVKDGKSWQRRIRVRIRAMALSKSRLVVAGPPDGMPLDDPLGPYEGRKGARLHVVDVATGEDATTFGLASSPVFNGIATAAGRLYVVGTDGTVSCYGTP
ncbi:MAG: PQQ-binding-like beta-propeller repeat protein [Victivallales bacterium]|nr:PQQ-binding-like beta-propeller repeat protein [Victivallales bacterium]